MHSFCTGNICNKFSLIMFCLLLWCVGAIPLSAKLLFQNFSSCWFRLLFASWHLPNIYCLVLSVYYVISGSINYNATNTVICLPIFLEIWLLRYFHAGFFFLMHSSFLQMLDSSNMLLPANELIKRFEEEGTVGF